jgi:hypothetical protein
MGGVHTLFSHGVRDSGIKLFLHELQVIDGNAIGILGPVRFSGCPWSLWIRVTDEGLGFKSTNKPVLKGNTDTFSPIRSLPERSTYPPT